MQSNNSCPVLTSGQLDVVKKIESFGGGYNLTSDLVLEDQLLVCESVAESTPVRPNYNEERETISASVSVNGSGNGSCKQSGNFELTQSKLQLITQLKECDYRTPPIEIAHLLEELFKEYPSKPGHWLYVTQRWSPKAINGVLNYMVKRQNDGWESIQNPPGYFTNLINHHRKRRSLEIPMVPANTSERKQK